jgi:urea carboxylase
MAKQQETMIESLQPLTSEAVVSHREQSPVIKTIAETDSTPQVVYRPAGDRYLLIEYGPLELDIRLRFRVHALMRYLQDKDYPYVLELTPGIRSLQVHYDSRQMSLTNLLEELEQAEQALQHTGDDVVPARIVHIPLSWDDEACRVAIDKYMRSVRKDAPWCPSNIEFIRRINGLDSIEQVKDIVFNASYLVMGLGDVYLGAPVATPIDPRHRLVTTKYNPARTWTAENSVGIGGSYLCVYGMEGPGGYQFVGRTLQMWNRYKQTDEFEQPWLLRFFDQIRFYEVSHDELEQIRHDFPRGKYPLKIEHTTFDLKAYEDFLQDNRVSINDFSQKREQAFDEELQRWIESGQINFDSSQDAIIETGEEEALPKNCMVIESPVAGGVWKLLVEPGDKVEAGQPLVVLESMKMEIDVTAPESGVVYAINREEGQQVNAGQAVLILELVK